MSDQDAVERGGLPSGQRGVRRARARDDTPCRVAGCPRPRDSAITELCSYHRHRQRQDKPLETGIDEVGARPSGHGLFGVVDRDEDAIMCHECGRWMRVLTPGHLSRHGLTPDLYRQRHGLAREEPLACESYRQAHREKLLACPDIIAAGTAAIAGRAGTEAAAAAARGRPVAPASAAARAEALPRGRTPRPCAICGIDLPTTARARTLTVCSRACEGIAKARAAFRRGALRASESKDFSRRDGSGGQITRLDIPGWLELTDDQVTYRLRTGAIPPHDGRTDWVPWWWISSLDQIGLRYQKTSRARGGSIAPPTSTART